MISYFCTYKSFSMDAKLTLKLDSDIIEKAKAYASEKKLSLSHLVENYFDSLTSGQNIVSDIEISPYVKSLSTKLDIPADFDYKKDRGDHLDQKYR